MRILFDATNIINEPTGAGIYSYRILKELIKSKTNHQIFILVREDLSSSNEIFSLPAVFIRKNIPTLGLRRELLLPFFLYKRRKEWDLFFCFMPYLCLLNITINTVITIHDVAFLRYPQFAPSFVHRLYFKMLMKLSVARARYVFTVSESSKKDILNFFNKKEESIGVAYPNSNLDFQLDIESNTGEGYFLFVGERRPHKNLENIIRAFSEYLKNGYQRDLVIIGRNYDVRYTKRIKGIANSLGVSSHIIWKEVVGKESLINCYKGSHALLLPSLYEGFGIPILEAMTIGVPVITSNIFSMPEVGGDAAIYCAPNDFKSITQAMILLEDKKTKECKIEKGKARASLFSWEKTARTIGNFLDNYELTR